MIICPLGRWLLVLNEGYFSPVVKIFHLHWFSSGLTGPVVVLPTSHGLAVKHTNMGSKISI